MSKIDTDVADKDTVEVLLCVGFKKLLLCLFFFGGQFGNSQIVGAAARRNTAGGRL
jgi:hypothetical protein